MGHRLAFLVVVVATSAACYTGTAAYIPQHYAARFDDATLLRAARRTLDADGLTVVRVHPAQGALVAISRVDASGGMATRERWYVHAAGGELGVRVRIEQRSDSGAWIGTDEVCDHYSYAREGYFAGAVRRAAAFDASATGALAASRGEPGALHQALAERAP